MCANTNLGPGSLRSLSSSRNWNSANSRCWMSEWTISGLTISSSASGSIVVSRSSTSKSVSRPGWMTTSATRLVEVGVNHEPSW